MNDQAPHPTPRRHGAGGLMLVIFAGLLVLLAALTATLVLPLITILTATGEGRGASWPVYVWLPLVFLAAIYSVVAGIQAMDEPRPWRILVLLGIAILAFFSFPPFWYAGP